MLCRTTKGVASGRESDTVALPYGSKLFDGSDGEALVLASRASLPRGARFSGLNQEHERLSMTGKPSKIISLDELPLAREKATARLPLKFPREREASHPVGQDNDCSLVF